MKKKFSFPTRIPNSKFRTDRLSVTVLLLLFCAMNVFAIETPDAPDGYSWMHVKEIQAAFLVPTTWYFSFKSAGSKNIYSISQERVKGGEFARTGLTVIVRKEESESGYGKGAPSDFAAAMLNEIKISRELERSQIGKQGPFETYRFQYLREEEGGETIREYNLFIANDSTRTLYIVTFSAPLAQWDTAWEKGKVILQNMIIDDEI